MPEVVRMIYLGQRGRRGKPLRHAWVEEAKPNGTVALFGTVKAIAVGSIYEVTVERNKDGDIERAGVDPKFTGDKYHDDAQIAAWKAIDKQARYDDNMRRLEKRNAASVELDKAMEPLNEILSRIRTHAEAEQFAAHVRFRLIDNWMKEKR